jgi:hypothetical protein
LAGVEVAGSVVDVVIGVDVVDVVGHAEEEAVDEAVAQVVDDAVDESAGAARTVLEVKAKMARMLGVNFILVNVRSRNFLG